MKTKPVKLMIAEPCHENWSNMTPNAQGRFCDSCRKTVVDFSIMPDHMILRFLEQSKGSVCGRMTGKQLNRELQPLSPVVQSSFSLRALVLGTAISSFCALNANGQNKMGKVAYHPIEPVVETPAQLPVEDTVQVSRDSVFSGTITDLHTGSGLEGVEIVIYDAQGNQLAATLSGTLGVFTIPLSGLETAYEAHFRKDSYLMETYYFNQGLPTRDVAVFITEEPTIYMGAVAYPDFDE